MELHKRHLIYLNIFLLCLHLRCITAAATISTPSSNIESGSAVTSSPIEDRIDVTTIAPLEENEGNYEVINSTANANSNSTTDLNVSESDIRSSTTESQEDIVQKEADEAEDLQHGGNFENIPRTINEDDSIILPKPIDNDEHGPSVEVEWIEEEEIEVDVPPFVQAMTDIYNDNNNKDYVYQGQLGILVAFLLVAFLVIGYVSFAVWKQFVVKRYGNREILINEEDMIDPSDMKHFSL